MSKNCSKGRNQHDWQQTKNLVRKAALSSKDKKVGGWSSQQNGIGGTGCKWMARPVYMETTTICDILDIPNVYKNNVSKEAIKDAIFSNIQMEIKLELLKSKKMENFKDDDFTKFQPYMMEKSLQQARMSFKVRCQMVETIKGNFKAKYKAGGDEKLKCGYCDSGDLETQLHCLGCPKWMNLRTNLDLNKI